MAHPIELNGVHFIEYTSSSPESLKSLFHSLGFKETAKHKTKDIDLFQHGGCQFLLNKNKNEFAENFSKLHGPSVCSLGFRVKNAKKSWEYACAHGAKAAQGELDHDFPACYGVGNSLIYFIEEDLQESAQFKFFEKAPANPWFVYIDHLTHNVPQGELQNCCDFYEKVFGFTERRYFDIKGLKTGLVSKVMQSPCNTITIPINEPAKDELGKQSQIQEYLDEYKGSGIQHIALATKNIINSIDILRKNKIEFLDVPDAYYEDLKSRVPGVKENLDDLAKYKILADGDQNGYLLQIFTQNSIGPIFYEVIQRAGHDGFGEGNFQALFDAIERSQTERGYLK